MLTKSCLAERSVQSTKWANKLLCDRIKKCYGLVSESTFHLTFRKLPLVKFWCSVEEFSQLSEKAIEILPPFLPTELCEAEFSSRTSTKQHYCNGLNAKNR